MVKWRPRETRDNLFKASDNNFTVVVYDLETTGLKADKDKIIQISGIKTQFTDGKLVEIERFDHYVNPEIPIPPKITEITGITDAMVFDKPNETDLFPEIKRFFGNSFVVSGYNVAKFDNNFMQYLYQKHNETFSPISTVDVLEMARDNVESTEVENFKLGTIASHFGVDKGLTFHNSMDDVIATKDLLTVFLSLYRSSYEEDEGLNSTENAEIELFDTKKQVTSVHSLRFWEGYRGFSRIYIGTDLGEFFYDIRKHTWSVNPKNNPYVVDEIDMETLKAQSFKKCGAKNEAEFISFNTPKKEKIVKDITIIENLKYWEKSTENGKHYQRIYITSDAGEFYFDIIKKQWLSNGGDVNATVDMEKLKTLCFAKAGVNNEDEFALYR